MNYRSYIIYKCDELTFVVVVGSDSGGSGGEVVNLVYKLKLNLLLHTYSQDTIITTLSFLNNCLVLRIGEIH